MEGDIRERESAAGTVDAENVWIIFLVGRVDERDDLSLIAEGLGEERANWAINLARGEDLFLAGAAFALDKSAWDASTGIGELAVFDGKGKKSMPSLGSGDATAVARTALSPLVVNAAPEACLAMRPVSN